MCMMGGGGGVGGGSCTVMQWNGRELPASKWTLHYWRLNLRERISTENKSSMLLETKFEERRLTNDSLERWRGGSRVACEGWELLHEEGFVFVSSSKNHLSLELAHNRRGFLLPPHKHAKGCKKPNSLKKPKLLSNSTKDSLGFKSRLWEGWIWS